MLQKSVLSNLLSPLQILVPPLANHLIVKQYPPSNIYNNLKLFFIYLDTLSYSLYTYTVPMLFLYS